ncbi:J domain-containing protein [Planctomicrobium sp. SH527]|uniref:J domain-containing protein n=1 Tax=Planctomicrobium sp. SH527 TaxID=3448123 RepID=UPI003F5C280E
MSPKDAFLILGLPERATWPEVQRRYKEEALAWHPDRFVAGSAQFTRAQERLKQLNAARDCLRRVLQTPDEAASETWGNSEQGGRQAERSRSNERDQSLVPVILGAVCGGMIASGLGWWLEINLLVAMTIGLVTGGTAGGASRDAGLNSATKDCREH